VDKNAIRSAVLFGNGDIDAALNWVKPLPTEGAEALVVLNIVLSDNLTIKSVLGFEDEQLDDIVTIDLYQNLTE